jgi:hypothetical protein
MGTLKRGSQSIFNTITGGLFEKPDVKQVPAIPMPDEEAIVRAKRRRIAQRQGGRDSTILTESNDTFGP